MDKDKLIESLRKYNKRLQKENKELKLLSKFQTAPNCNCLKDSENSGCDYISKQRVIEIITIQECMMCMEDHLCKKGCKTGNLIKQIQEEK
jgi:hypothetical protein